MDMTYATHHNIPRNVIREAPSMVVRVLCSVALSVRSVGGFYQTTHTLSVVPFQRTWDIILGRDWCLAAGASVEMGSVLDPIGSSTDHRYLWCAVNDRTLHCSIAGLFSLAP